MKGTRQETATVTQVIGVGNEYRGDDAVGLVVARRLARRCPPGARVVTRTGEMSELLDTWRGAERVILVDAQRSGREPGTIARYTAREIVSAGKSPLVSSHGLGLAEAVRLGAALGRLPERLVIYGIEGKSYDPGAELSPEVDAAAERAVELILEELACTSTPWPGPW